MNETMAMKPHIVALKPRSMFSLPRLGPTVRSSMMSIGAAGVISVASNVIPGEMKLLTDAALTDDWIQARNLHRKLFPLWRALFVETNPIPVKTSLAMMGKINEEFRLPLCSMADANKDKLKKALKDYGLI